MDAAIGTDYKQSRGPIGPAGTMDCIECAAEFNRLIARGSKLPRRMHRVQSGHDGCVTPAVEQPRGEAWIGDGRKDRGQRERDQQLDQGESM